jgi:hypothetical protein
MIPAAKTILPLCAAATLSLALVTPQLARADQPIEASTASLGIGLGDPAAVDLKLWTGRSSGFDFGIGVEQFADILGLYAEYEHGLVEFPLGRSGARGAFYLGAGGALAFTRNETRLAAVIPVGFDFRFRIPLDLFIEGRPGIGILHRPVFGIGAQIGLRYRF